MVGKFVDIEKMTGFIIRKHVNINVKLELIVQWFFLKLIDKVITLLKTTS